MYALFFFVAAVPPCFSSSTRTHTTHIQRTHKAHTTQTPCNKNAHSATYIHTYNAHITPDNKHTKNAAKTRNFRKKRVSYVPRAPQSRQPRIQRTYTSFQLSIIRSQVRSDTQKAQQNIRQAYHAPVSRQHPVNRRGERPRLTPAVVTFVP